MISLTIWEMRHLVTRYASRFICCLFLPTPPLVKDFIQNRKGPRRPSALIYLFVEGYYKKSQDVMGYLVRFSASIKISVR